MNQDNIEDLLDRYLKRETTFEENQRIEQWLKENGNASHAWQKLDPLDKDQWLSDVFAEIKNTIGANKANYAVLEPKLPIQRKYLWNKIAGAAAVLIVFLSFFLSRPLFEKRILPSDLTVISVPNHQKKQVTLPDGSRVWLNAGSQLKYPKNFTGRLRAVYLSGEAYFDIQHDEHKPFLIHTGKILTTVLGTAFNIKEDQHRHTIEVTVTRGKVSVADGGKLLGTLTPNRQLSINLLNNLPIEKIVNAEAVVAWKDADLFFDDITFADAAIQLQQHFHVKIAFSNDQLKNCRFSGTALEGDYLDKILKVICAFNHATWQIKPDKHILISGAGCN